MARSYAGIAMTDRYKLSEDFQTELARREILSCESIETLRDLSLLLLKSNLSQRQMIGKMILDAAERERNKD